MADVEIKVDVVGQIRLFQDYTFPSKYPFIEEAIQNAQRSKAGEVEIWINEEQIVITDDGIGLTDPNDLFTIAHSGWDEETKRDQKPFGLGFFSCVKMAKLITVESNEIKAVLDVDKVLRGDTKVQITTLAPPIKGFRVKLQKLRKEFDYWNAVVAAENTAKYIHKLNIYVNGDKVEKAALNSDNSKFVRRVLNPGVKGWVRPFNWLKDSNPLFGYETGVKIFYQDRYVSYLWSGIQICGVIEVGNNVIDLRAPDRKDFIDNEKLANLRGLLKSHAEAIALDIVERGGDTEIDSYAVLIEEQLQAKDYKDKLRYTIIRSEEGYNRLQEQFKGDPKKLANLPIEELISLVQPDYPGELLNEDLDLQTSFNPATNQVSVKSGGVERHYEIEAKKSGEILPTRGLDQLIYYVNMEELLDYPKIVLEALKYDIPIIVVKNRLEKEAIKLREDILHVSELIHRVEWSAKLEKGGAIDELEQRADWLFKIIAKLLGIEESPFIIGDIKAKKAVKFGPVKISEEDIIPFGMCDGKRILVDRGKLQISALTASKAKRLLASDLKFIGVNLDTIAHELTHLLYRTEDDTPSHYKLQLEVTRRIVEKIFT